jgi:hypothetical protein
MRNAEKHLGRTKRDEKCRETFGQNKKINVNGRKNLEKKASGKPTCM